MLEIGGVRFRVVVILCAVILLSGCSASDKFFDAIHDPIHAVVDKLPAWAGGRPDALPLGRVRQQADIRPGLLFNDDGQAQYLTPLLFGAMSRRYVS
jgi:outer membrane biogenesis lipoprotein LolB